MGQVWAQLFLMTGIYLNWFKVTVCEFYGKFLLCPKWDKQGTFRFNFLFIRFF